MAIIRINDLKLKAVIGAHPWESANKQDLVIHMAIEYDASKACRSDALKDAINYELVVRGVINIVKRSRYTLLEKLASKILEEVMVNRRVQSAFVRIDKPRALPKARCVSFEISKVRCTLFIFFLQLAVSLLIYGYAI